MAQQLSEETRTLVRSRIKNYAHLTPEEQLRAAIKVIAEDFYIYCERNLMIQDKVSGEIVPFRLNWAQKLLVDRVLLDIAEGRPVRYIILKARQMGLSTVIEALCYWWTTTHKNIKSVIIAHETEAAGNLYDMFKRYFDNAHAVPSSPAENITTKKSSCSTLKTTSKRNTRLRARNRQAWHRRSRRWLPKRAKVARARFTFSTVPR
jgi:hypothetical protein